ncbi:MAG: MBL fold metallo-hydrolase [Bacteroidia bacterium]
MMYIQQLYTNCLAQAAYYVESEGEALIIDPLREPEPYIQLAKSRNARIKYVFETHFHADFVSGHLDLNRLAGAEIIFGPNAKPGYNAVIAADGEIFSLGKLSIEVLHTPGHTIESSCFLLRDENNVPYCVFTGDTLFIGDVGRPDLLSGNLSKEELASFLYDSLQKKIKTLPDEVIVYPGHGAGSACGKNIGKETSSTIGMQKKLNYAMAELTREEFIKAVTSDLPTPPPYFFKDAKINITGYDSFEVMFNREMKALGAAEVRSEIAKGALILDSRPAEEFEKGFIPGSINIGINGDFAAWVGALINFDTPLVLVTQQGKEAESITRLARIGYEKVKGVLKEGINTWISAGEPVNKIESVSVADIEKLISDREYMLLDVRRPGEVAQFHLKNSVHICLNELPEKLKTLDKSKKYLVYCAGGYRSMIAASFMFAGGFTNIKNLQGGINRLKQEKPLLLEY